MTNEMKGKRPFYGRRKFKLIYAFHLLRKFAKSSNPCERVMRQSFNCSNPFIQEHFIEHICAEQNGSYDRPSRIFESINYA